MRISIVAGWVVLIVGSLCGQTSRGTVSGMVTDTQKSAVPGATVELTGLDTNVTRTTQANEDGLYRFDAVDLGAYKLVVKTTGFRTLSIPEFTVSAAQVVTQDATLEIGELQQVVEVTDT